jgi:hypothetical protein
LAHRVSETIHGGNEGRTREVRLAS